MENKSATGYIKVMREEDDLCINGASRADIGNAELHRNAGQLSEKQWRKHE